MPNYILLPRLLLCPVIISAWEASLRWSPDSPILFASVTHYFTMDRTRDAIVELRIQFREDIFYKKKTRSVHRNAYLPTFILPNVT